MPIKKSRVSRAQPSLPTVPPPEFKKAKQVSSEAQPNPKREMKHQSRGGDLFIVDNSDEQWKAEKYLADWCEVARALDVATGYFEIGALLALDGQWQKLDQVRILMGDEVTKRTHKAFLAALEGLEKTLDDSIEREKENNDFLTGVPAIVDALIGGKIACKVYKERKFHAKAYITHSRFEVMGSTALVGSSNFTYPGLTENIELNIRIRSEVETLQEWYEKYWEEAEEVTPEFLRVIERHIREYSPFEVYMKALYEFFRGHEMTPGEWECSQSRMYSVLDEYQREGYHALLKIAARYNGGLLCDSVGLGKTFIGLMLIERMLFERKRVALLVPKAARKPVWENKINHYLPGAGGVFSNLAVYNHTDLLRGGEYPQIMDEIAREADVVIIDEAHHFRNQATDSYRKLFEMLEGKQVFLLTATPINNSSLDLQHQIELFSRRQPDYFKAAPLGIHSLPGHFRSLENALKKVVGETVAEDVELSAVDAEKILSKDDLFRNLVVQRSRAYAKRSQQQFGGQKVFFPERLPPQVASYSLAKTYGVLLEHLEKAFLKDKPLLSLAIYFPLNYTIEPEIPGAEQKPTLFTGEMMEIEFQKGRQAQVVGLIRTQLLKRFESSGRAFEDTCEHLLLKLLAFTTVHSQTQAEGRRLGRWSAQHYDLLQQVKTHQAEHYAEDEPLEEDILPVEFLEKVEVLPRDQFRVDEILDETFLDMDQLIVFLQDIKDFSANRDDKLQSLISLLQTDPLLSRNKVIIFSEYMATARYLGEELRKAGIGPLDEVDSSVNKDRGEIITAFSPYYNDSSTAELSKYKVQETRVLISTDVLSEGLNLQDATLLINYDLHWNPVRLMQRIGRVDRRLDTAIEERMVADHPDYQSVRGHVHFWNFLPPGELDRLLQLYERVAHKTLRISKLFGIEGRQLLKPDDDYQALKEFSQTYEGAPTQAETMRLAYRDLLAAHPGLEEKLERFPGRVFSGKAHPMGGVQALFLCYNLPARNLGTGEWDTEAGFTQWYLYDLQTEQILQDPDEINRLIYSEPITPRHCAIDQADLVSIRKKVESHIKNTYLKSVQAPAGIKAVLKAWMELN